MSFYPEFPELYENKIKDFFNYDFRLIGTYAKEVKSLSDSFLKKKIKPVYFGYYENLRAYSFFYFPQNYIKTRYIISLVKELFFEQREINILDFGGGPGNSTLALRDEFKDKKYKIYYFDKQQEGYKFLKSIDNDNNIIKKDINLITDKIDIFFFSYTIKEIGLGLIDVLNKLSAIEKPNSLYVFLDAPDTEVLSKINKIKKKFLDGGYNTIFPCRAKECPVIKLKKDEERTCYTQIDWVIPKIVSDINRKLLFRIKYLKFSSLIVSKRKSDEDYLFSISPYIGEKGKGRVYFCFPEGRIKIELLKKDISENNEKFLKIKRGDAVKINESTVEGKDIRLSPKDTVKILDKII